MKTGFIVASSVVTILATVPYIIDVLKRGTKPRVVSWLTWAMLTGISAAASFSAHQYPAAILSISASVECLTVVFLGLKYGDRSFEKFDLVCQIAAVFGLILWWAFDSPSIAIIAAILIDFVAGLPTIRHSWQKPQEETWLTFALSGLGAIFTLLAVDKFMVTSAANPIYLVFINAMMTTIIISRKKKKLTLSR